jgi:hypothetical protein
MLAQRGAMVRRHLLLGIATMLVATAAEPAMNANDCELRDIHTRVHSCAQSHLSAGGRQAGATFFLEECLTKCLTKHAAKCKCFRQAALGSCGTSLP